MTAVAQGGVFPIAPEPPQKAFRIIDDAEAFKAGIPTELTEADKLREENARLRELLARGAGATVVDDRSMLFPGGVKSQPPLFTEPAKDKPRPAIPWDHLPTKTQRELEAGRRALGGGLSAREAYEASVGVHAPSAPPTPMMVVVPPPVPEPVMVLPPRTIAEQERGRASVAAYMGEHERITYALAVKNAERLARGDKPTGDEMYYPPQPV